VVVSIDISLSVRVTNGEEVGALEEWGIVKVVAVPRVGESLDVERNGILEFVDVTSVHHFAVPASLPTSNMPNTQRKSPSVKVYGKWEAHRQWDF
jgi:putative protein kinase ArgK-like GTPase of G3E family